MSEDLRKEFENEKHQNVFWSAYIDGDNLNDELVNLRYVEWLEYQLTECKAQIEAMKCCGNCANYLVQRHKEPCLSCGQTRGLSHWQPKGMKQ